MPRNPIPPALIRLILERDEGLCQKCHGRGEDIHHIVFGGTGRRRVHREENMLTLCRACHDTAHSKRWMREWTYEWSRERYGNVVDKLLREKWGA